MSGSQTRLGFSLHTPAMVNITIVGYLDDSWSEQLGMSIDHATINDGMSVTVLKGELVDQAALFGVLNGLYGLGFPLVSVDCEPRLQINQEQATNKPN
jgi:hypothetical protein